MRVWRLLLDVGGLYTFLVLAPDHLHAWELALQSIQPTRRKRAVLEELENTGSSVSGGDRARVIAAWRGSPQKA